MNDRPTPSPQSLQVAPHVIGGTVLFIATLLIMAKGFASGSLVLMALPPAALLTALLFFRPTATFICFVALHNTTLMAPGFPQAVDISRLLLLLWLTATIPAVIIHKQFRRDPSPLRGLALAYGILLFITMYIRGFGLRILGSDNWGGTESFVHFIFVGAFLFRSQVLLTPRQWVAALLTMMIASALPMMVDYLYIFSGGATRPLYSIFAFNISSTLAGSEAAAEFGVWRLQRALIFIPCLAQLAYYLYERRKIRGLGLLLLMAATIGLIGLSGHRIGLVTILLITAFFWALRRPHRVARQAAIWLVAGFVGFLTLFMTVRFLPLSFQRAAAILPFLPVSSQAKLNAEGTLNWRLAVWAEARPWIPRYFWIGRGLILTSSELLQLHSMQMYHYYRGERISTVEMAVLMRDYHNGPLALQIDLGIFGTLIGISFMILLGRESVRTSVRKDWRDPRLKLLHNLLTSQILTELVLFFLIYGSAVTLVRMMMLGTITYGLRASDQRIQTAQAPTRQVPVRRRTIHL